MHIKRYARWKVYGWRRFKDTQPFTVASLLCYLAIPLNGLFIRLYPLECIMMGVIFLLSGAFMQANAEWIQIFLYQQRKHRKQIRYVLVKEIELRRLYIDRAIREIEIMMPGNGEIH